MLEISQVLEEFREPSTIWRLFVRHRNVGRRIRVNVLTVNRVPSRHIIDMIIFFNSILWITYLGTKYGIFSYFLQYRTNIHFFWLFKQFVLFVCYVLFDVNVCFFFVIIIILARMLRIEKLGSPSNRSLYDNRTLSQAVKNIYYIHHPILN